METTNSYLRLKGLSLQQRLPLLICILLLSLMVLFSWISYQGVKNAALTTGRERLLSLTNQFSSMFAQTMSNHLSSTRMTANQPAFKNFLLQRDERTRDSALQAVQKIRQDTITVLVDLLDANYQLLLRSAKDSIQQRVNFDSLQKILTNHRDTAIRNIYVVRDSMFYPVIIPILGDHKHKLGYLVRWRLLSASPQTIEQVTKLMGTRAALYIGNADGSLWTDLLKPIAYLRFDSTQWNKPIRHADQEGRKYIVAAKPIVNTPWLVSVEFSQQNVLEAANRFLGWMIIAGLVLLVIGILLAWIMSRNIIQPLNRLTAATSGIAAGQYMPSEEIERRDEVGKLARAFNTMIGQVREARQGLEQKIVETGEMNEQLRQLTAHLQNIREEERIHIAREMHDELGQLLTAFKMDISWLKKRLAANEDSAIHQKLAGMNQLIDDSVGFVRKLASELRPSVLDDFGLVPALEWHSEEFEKRFNIKVDFNSSIKELKTPAVIATGLFRMYQESLTNVARHAQATLVSANLQVTSDSICLSIGDNGKGFDMNSSQQRKTLGLLGMKERAAMMGGNLDIHSTPGKGTLVKVTLPRLLEA